MSVSLQDFNRAIAQYKGNPINSVAIDALNSALTGGEIAGLIANAAKGDTVSRDRLLRMAVVAGLYARLTELGFENVQIAQARAMLAAQGVDSLRNAVGSALSGDANARTVLAGWLNRAIAAAAPATPPATGGHTPMPPPPSRPAAGAPAQPPARFAAEPARPTGQAYRTTPPSPPVSRAESAAQDRWGRGERGGEPADAGGGPATVTQRTYDQAKAHGGRAALTFAADLSTHDSPTVVIEAADLLSKQDRTYDWANKLRFQLTAPELLLVTALLLKHLPELHFSNHGAQNDKWMTVVRQDQDDYAGTIKFTLGQGKATDNRPRTVQVDFSSLGPILSLCMRQATRLLKLEDGTLLRVAIKEVAEAYALQLNRKGGGGGQRRSA